MAAGSPRAQLVLVLLIVSSTPALSQNAAFDYVKSMLTKYFSLSEPKTTDAARELVILSSELAHPSGSRGDTGPQGPPGSNGVIGYRGLPGNAGRHGNNGIPGPQGAPSYEPGENNAVTGRKGEKGNPGSPGSPGFPGDQGPAGDPGMAAALTDQDSRNKTAPFAVIARKLRHFREFWELSTALAGGAIGGVAVLSLVLCLCYCRLKSSARKLEKHGNC